jgi:hypothetical protein
MPALLVVAPGIVSVGAWIPSLSWSAVFGVAGALGLFLWMSQLARDRGKRLEPQLFAKWGGKPTTVMLRYSARQLPEQQKMRYHAFLKRAVHGIKLPSLKEESSNPTKADEAYEAAVAWLLTRTRDKKPFALIFEENMNYGFRRNLLGMKPIALLVGFSSLVVNLVLSIFAFKQSAALPIYGALVTLYVSIHILGISLAVNGGWVKTAALAYATQLLAACDVLPAPTIAARPEKKGSRTVRKTDRSPAAS